MKQEQQRRQHDRSSHHRHFEVGQSVYCKNHTKDPPWLPGTIETRTGPTSFTVRLEDGRTWRRHQDHIQSRREEIDLSSGDTPELPCETTRGTKVGVDSDRGENVSSSVEKQQEELGSEMPAAQQSGAETGDTTTTNTPTIRRSSRPRKAPNKLDL